MPDIPSWQIWLSATETAVGLLALGAIWRAKKSQPPALGRWAISFTSFFSAVLCVAMAYLCAMVLLGLVTRFAPALATHPSWSIIANLAVIHTCLIAGALTGAAFIKASPDWLQGDTTPPIALTQPPHYAGSTWVAGIATFLASLAVVHPLNLLTQFVLHRAGLNIEAQDQLKPLLLEKSFWPLAIFIIFAVLFAPIGEELIFRAGLFRYLRARVPRVVAFLVPAVLFAGPHVNPETKAGLASLLPLIGLAVLWSKAYELTGRIGVTIIAHGLFNLHTVIIVLAMNPA